MNHRSAQMVLLGTAVLACLLVALAGGVATIKAYLFYKRIDSCFEGQGKYDVTYNSPLAGLRKVNISLYPSFLSDSKLGRFLGGAIGKVEHIWLTSPSTDSQQEVSGLYGLSGLGVRGKTEFDGESIERLGKKGLKHLHLNSTGIGDEEFAKLLNSGKVEDLLIVDEPHLSGRALSILGSLRSLDRLVLAGLPSVTAPEWEDIISMCGRVSYLHVNASGVGDDAIERLPVPSELESILLLDTNISDRGVRTLRKHESLREIIIRDGNISVQGLRLLDQLPFLEGLVISGVPMDRDEIEELRQSMPKCNITIFPERDSSLKMEHVLQR